MRDNDLFQLALGITSPWFVASSAFDAAKRRLDIGVDFKAGSRFACPDCNADGCPVHDTIAKTWRHLDFFQHQAFLTARVPRITCGACGVRQVGVPWARKGSGFTLLFEALAMALVTHMPVAAAARLIGEHDTRIWRIVFHYVEAAVARMDLGALRRVCIDETAAMTTSRCSSTSTAAASSTSPTGAKPRPLPSSPIMSMRTTVTRRASNKSAST
jgi:transposase